MQTTQLICDFCLDEHVPENRLLRRMDRFLDLEKVRREHCYLRDENTLSDRKRDLAH
jgi:hypothetical protein